MFCAILRKRFQIIRKIDYIFLRDFLHRVQVSVNQNLLLFIKKEEKYRQLYYKGSLQNKTIS